jgi:hypothetical protein
LTINRYTLYQVFKYALYIFLSMNIYWFFAEEFAANKLLYPDGVRFSDIMDAYVAAVDTLSWVILLLMFELETYILEERHFTKPVTWTLHTLRAVCYVFIVYAFWGYIGNLMSASDVSPLPGVTELCSLVTDNWSYSFSRSMCSCRKGTVTKGWCCAPAPHRSSFSIRFCLLPPCIGAYMATSSIFGMPSCGFWRSFLSK